ncbi:MAG: VTT domain-containing protein [Xanthomonadaceae bacterium]|nr:VTT domain-containing protein [Xanthomonadaceae bacterium]
MSLPDFQQLLSLADGHIGWVVAIGFALALIEALAIVGIIVPGILLLFLLAALVGWNPPALLALAMALMTGAVAGDGLSFWLGRRYSDRLASVWPLSRNTHWFDLGRQFIERHGGKSVFIARFLGPLRPIVPMMAGSLGMPPRRFVPQMLLACLIWTPAVILPGALFGESLELASEFGGRLALLLVVVFLGGWLVAWLTRLAYEWGARRGQWWLKNLALWLRRHPVVGRWAGPLFQPGGREVMSVTILGLLLVLSLAALFAALLLAPFSTAAWQAGFELSGLAASLRSHFADPLFFLIALATSAPVLAALTLVESVWLAYGRRWNALGHWLLAILGGGFLALVLNGLMGVLLDRPSLAGSVAMVPHPGLTLTTLIFGFLALMTGKGLRPRQRKWLYLVTSVLLAGIAFTEFYLARATLNGLIAGAALGLGWLALVGIGYRLRAARFAAPAATLSIFVLAWMLCTGLAVFVGYGELERAHRLDQPIRQFESGQWRNERWRELPQQRSRIGDPQRQRFDLQLAMPAAALGEALEADGWHAPPELSPAGLRAIFSDRVEIRRLPHLGRDFAGQPDQLAFRKRIGDQRVVLLRAWDSGARLEPGGIPVWLAQVRLLEPATRFGFFNTWTELDQGRARALASLGPVFAQDQQRRPQPDGPLLIQIQSP